MSKTPRMPRSRGERVSSAWWIVIVAPLSFAAG
jgi:hypothetical protein